jgi:hypothetical protein
MLQRTSLRFRTKPPRLPEQWQTLQAENPSPSRVSLASLVTSAWQQSAASVPQFPSRVSSCRSPFSFPNNLASYEPSLDSLRLSTRCDCDPYFFSHSCGIRVIYLTLVPRCSQTECKDACRKRIGVPMASLSPRTGYSGIRTASRLGRPTYATSFCDRANRSTTSMFLMDPPRAAG